MLVLTLIIGLLASLVQVADSTVAVVGPAWWGVGLLGLWQVLGPIAASWLFKQWTALQEKLTGFVKSLAYVAFSTLALQVPKWVSYVLDSDPNTWTAGIFFDLLTSVGATILYRFGTKPNAAVPVAARRVG